ncbi:MAG: sulfonate transport system substrate-binding protein [Pseudonocardiales bacterium]|nr:sulfonate transport system substrate-binding protein [Pseudonocardiales bacterium]
MPRRDDSALLPHPRGVRRTWRAAAPAVVAAAVLAATAACGGGSAPAAGGSGTAAGPLPVSITQFATSFASLPEYVANRKGFFTDNGLKATMVQVANGTAASQAVLSGSADMSTNSIYEILAAHQKGQPLQYIAGGVAGGFGEIVTAPGQTLPHAQEGFPGVIQDLKGKRVGVSSIGAGTYYELTFLLGKAGMTPSDVTIVAAGALPAQLAALKAGQLDAFMSQEPVTSQVLATDSGTVVYSLGTGPNPPPGSEHLMANGVVASTDWINGHPEEVKRVNAAVRQAVDYIKGLNDQSAGDLATLLAPDLQGIPHDVVAKAILNYRNVYEAEMAPEGVDIGNQQLVAAKVIPAPVAYNDVVNAIAREAS